MEHYHRMFDSARAAWRKLYSYGVLHKFWAGVVIILVLYGGYRVYAAATAPSTATRYVTSTVATGTIVASLSETGQVSASQQLSLSPKGSGQVVGVYVKDGQHVVAGQLIAQLDATDAEQSLANAQLSLANAQLSYQQTTSSSTLALNLLEAQNGVTNAQVSVEKTHDASYASLANVYSDFSSTMSDVNSDLHDSDIAGRQNETNLSALSDSVTSYDTQINVFSSSAQSSYTAAVAAYNTALAEYKATSLSASDSDIETLSDETYVAAQAVAEAVKDSHDFFTQVNSDYALYNLKAPAELATLISAVNGDTTTITGDLSNTLTAKSNIVSAEQSLAEAQDSLAKVEGGSNALTVQSANLSLEQSEQAVTSAEENLADYGVRAPFDGTIAAVGVQKYDQAGSGTSVATIVTDQETVDLSVNEVDASKIQVGQKATLTFDALPDITVAGTVASIDLVGAVAQGVVSYDVVVTFDTPNAQVLPGMSATAEIITGSETGLVIPSSAVKTAGGAGVVQVFNPPLAGSGTSAGATSTVAPMNVPVTTGLSDDTNVIVESGLSAGEQIVTQTIAGTAATVKPTAAASATSLFGAGGGTRTFGGGAAGAGATRTLTR